MMQGPEALGPYTRTEVLAVALGALFVAVALAAVIHPLVGIVWLLATGPGVWFVVRSLVPARAAVVERPPEEPGTKPHGRG